jgi:adenylate kinase
MDRLRAKGYPSKKVFENVQAEILDVVLRDALEACGRGKVVQLDMSRGLDDKFLGVVEALERGGTVRSDSVDWLGLVIANGDLDRFFPEGIDLG